MTDMKLYYTAKMFSDDMGKLCAMIHANMIAGHIYTRIYGVPRGGWIIAAVLSEMLDLELIDDLAGILPDDDGHQTIVVDDVVDSGNTLEQYKDLCFFVSIHAKPGRSMDPDIFLHETDKWIVYFWERQEGQGIENNVRRVLQYIGEDPGRQGLLETPKRVIKAYDFMFSGYKMDPASIIKTFDETDGYDEMIWLSNIELYSMCEHHMLPFIGRAHVAYIPDKRVIGASKLARLVDIFARRLQIQERLTHQVTRTLMDELKPIGAACVIEAQHLCMTMRGVQKQHTIMTTSSLKGVFMTKPEVRQEFMSRIGRLEL